MAKAKAIDEAEDELYGDARGEELPEQLRTREGRREFFRQAREKLAAEDGDADEPSGPKPEPTAEPFEFNAEQIVARAQGRDGWVREARRQVEQRRWRTPQAIPRGRVDRLLLAAERMEDDLDARLAGNRATTTSSRLGARYGRMAVYGVASIFPAAEPGDSHASADRRI